MEDGFYWHHWGDDEWSVVEVSRGRAWFCGSEEPEPLTELNIVGGPILPPEGSH